MIVAFGLKSETMGAGMLEEMNVCVEAHCSVTQSKEMTDPAMLRLKKSVFGFTVEIDVVPKFRPKIEKRIFSVLPIRQTLVALLFEPVERTCVAALIDDLVRRKLIGVRLCSSTGCQLLVDRRSPSRDDASTRLKGGGR